MENFITIKAHYENDAKKLYIAKSMDYTHFLTAMRGMFPKGFNVIKYRDEDGELVTMGSKEEFEEAITKVSPLVNNRLNVFLEQKDGHVFAASTSQRKIGKDDKMKEIIVQNEIQRHPSTDNFKEEYSLVSVSDMDSEKVGKSPPPKGKNPVEFYSSVTKSLFAEVNGPEQKVCNDVAEKEKKAETSCLKDVSNGIPGVVELPLQRTEKGRIEKIGRNKKNKKRGRKGRHESSSSSSSEDDQGRDYFVSDIDGELYAMSLSSEGSSSNSDTSSNESSLSGSSTDSETSADEFEKVNGSKPNQDTKGQNMKKGQRRNRIKMMARKLTHYIAPDVCDEVEHCMHSFEKNVKKNLAEKITVCIEDSIKVAFKEHASALAVCGANVAEKESQRKQFYHEDITCDGCDQTIYGPRFKCGNCADYDLCSVCEAKEGIHDETHVFLKIIRPSRNAGRKNGKGRMRPLLKENIYLFGKSEVSSGVQPKNKDIEEEFKSVSTSKPSAFIAEKPMDKPLDESQDDVKKAEAKMEEPVVSGNNSNDLIFSEKEKVNSCSKIERTETGAETAVGSKVDKTIESESKARNNDTDDDVIVLGKYQNERKSSTRTPDLVDVDAESNVSDDFVVVPKFFDFNSPLDENTVLQHRLSCAGCHSELCCTHEKNASTSAKMTVDLVASTIKEPRPQPSGDPDITNSERNAHNLVANQPDVNLPSSEAEAKDAVTVQPELTIRFPPATDAGHIEMEEPAVVTKEQPMCSKVNDDTPVTKQPEPMKVNQPEALVMYGRGTVTKVDKNSTEEPGPLVIREFGAANTNVCTDGMKEAKDEVKETCKPKPKAPSAPEYPGDHDIIPFKPPTERFLMQQSAHEMKGRDMVKTPPTWSPDSIHPTDEVYSPADLLADTFNGIADATASAANAVYEGVSNALNPGNGLPPVKYENQRVVIGVDDDKVFGIPRPMQSSSSPATQFHGEMRVAMSANDMLCDMGFYDRARNERLLKRFDGNVERCVAELLSDNNWHANRH